MSAEYVGEHVERIVWETTTLEDAKLLLGEGKAEMTVVRDRLPGAPFIALVAARRIGEAIDPNVVFYAALVAKAGVDPFAVVDPFAEAYHFDTLEKLKGGSIAENGIGVVCKTGSYWASRPVVGSEVPDNGTDATPSAYFQAQSNLVQSVNDGQQDLGGHRRRSSSRYPDPRSSGDAHNCLPLTQPQEVCLSTCSDCPLAGGMVSVDRDVSPDNHQAEIYFTQAGVERPNVVVRVAPHVGHASLEVAEMVWACGNRGYGPVQERFFERYLFGLRRRVIETRLQCGGLYGYGSNNTPQLRPGFEAIEVSPQ